MSFWEVEFQQGHATPPLRLVIDPRGLDLTMDEPRPSDRPNVSLGNEDISAGVTALAALAVLDPEWSTRFG